jgi:hypothetical protein
MTCAAEIWYPRLTNAQADRVLGCGQPARPYSTERHGPPAQRHGVSGYCPERGVHSLWIRLLIRLWGRKVSSR